MGIGRARMYMSLRMFIMPNAMIAVAFSPVG
jgi:hypothetical protein